MGIHSIIIIQLISRLKKSGYSITVEEFLEYPVIEDLAEFIKYKSNSQIQSESNEEVFLVEQDFENEVVLEEHNYFKEWKYGDVVPLSPNQYRFFKLPHLKATYEFEMSDYREEIFESEFRLFLSKFPMLTVELEEKNGKIFQRYIPSDIIKFKLVIEDLSLKNEDEIRKIGESFSLKSWDFLHDELIRVFIIIDQNKAKIYLTIPYIFFDTYSDRIFRTELINFFRGNKREIDYYHPFTFISYQMEFLRSKKGHQERKYWVESLKKIPMIDNAINVSDAVAEPVMLQSTFISGDNFEKIKKIATKYSLPISTFFNSFFEMIINDFNCSDKKLYGILIDGRELEIKKIEVSKIMGVINNMIPLTYIDYAGFNIDGVIKCYAKYLNARKHQRVPYETICGDLLKVSGKELNKNLIGYFNFKILDNFKIIDNSENIDTTIMNTNPSTYDICLSCDLHPNGIAIRLFSLNKMYEQNKEALSLKNNIVRFLKILD